MLEHMHIVEVIKILRSLKWEKGRDPFAFVTNTAIDREIEKIEISLYKAKYEL